MHTTAKYLGFKITYHLNQVNYSTYAIICVFRMFTEKVDVEFRQSL